MPDPPPRSDRPDPAMPHAEPAEGAPTVDQDRFTDVGEEAERTAFREDGAYSGGDFAGGQVIT